MKLKYGKWSLMEKNASEKKQGQRLLTTVAEAVERGGKTKIVLLAACIALLLIIIVSCLPGSCGASRTAEASKTEGEERNSANMMQAERIESRLEAILSSMAGVGKVRVMVTLEGEGAADGKSGDLLLWFTAQPSGDEAAPAGVRGAVVVAEGAENLSVRFNIAEAVSTVLGIDEACVGVFPMGR